METIEQRLTGGHPNSLGNTVEVVDEILAGTLPFDELFMCYSSEDEVVRLRVSNAIKRITKADKSRVTPYITRLLEEISSIDQASTQWTLAQLFVLLEKDMNQDQIQQAKKIMQRNLANHQDWIVLNTTMESLTRWAKQDEALKVWLIPHLERLKSDSRKSVAKRATKFLKQLTQ